MDKVPDACLFSVPVRRNLEPGIDRSCVGTEKRGNSTIGGEPVEADHKRGSSVYPRGEDNVEHPRGTLRD